ncbi:MAG: AAC(3) family N-acetyltransferase [Ruminococcaceae bacterium]|nr:AAC(3) family N-acetyltransferase [Oscillospiraceae bacterium]
MLTKVDIHDFLIKNNIKKSDTVLIHTSMRALGEVEGGCDGLIDGFASYLTDGLFLVPTHTWANVNKNQPIYDVRSTVPCIGALPTVAAFRKDGIRSLHPTHSLAAFGKRAAEFVRGEEFATPPCFLGGAWSRLYEEDAKILLLGVGLDKNTYIHAIDEMVDAPGKLSEQKQLTIIDYDGNSRDVIYRSHSHPTSQYFVNYQKPLDTLGVLSYSKLGDATVTMMGARELTHVLKKIWSNTNYDITESYNEIPESYYMGD